MKTEQKALGNQEMEQMTDRIEEMVSRMSQKVDLPDRKTQPIEWAQEMAMLKAQAREAMMYDSLY